MSNPVLKVENYSVDFWVDGVWYPAAIQSVDELGIKIKQMELKIAPIKK